MHDAKTSAPQPDWREQRVRIIHSDLLDLAAAETPEELTSWFDPAIPAIQCHRCPWTPSTPLTPLMPSTRATVK